MQPKERIKSDWNTLYVPKADQPVQRRKSIKLLSQKVIKASIFLQKQSSQNNLSSKSFSNTSIKRHTLVLC